MKDLTERRKTCAETLEEYGEREAESFISRRIAERIYFKRLSRGENKQVQYYGSLEAAR